MSCAARRCDTCGVEKRIDEFRARGRGHSKTCIGCEVAADALDDAAEPAAELRPAFTIRASFGLDVALDSDGDLVLTQETASGTASIYLTEAEVHQLVAELQTRLGLSQEAGR